MNNSINRQQVVDAILSIETAEDVARARELRDEWVRLHPDDQGVLDASRGLEEVAKEFGMTFKPITA